MLQIALLNLIGQGRRSDGLFTAFVGYSNAKHNKSRIVIDQVPIAPSDNLLKQIQEI